MEKEEEVDQRPRIAIIFENLMEIRALLIYIDWYRIEKHREPRLFNSMNFPSSDDDGPSALADFQGASHLQLIKEKTNIENMCYNYKSSFKYR